MTRDTDRSIIADYQTITARLLEMAHELVTTLQMTVLWSDIDDRQKDVVRANLTAAQDMIVAMHEKHKSIMAMQQENVQRSLHGGEE